MASSTSFQKRQKEANRQEKLKGKIAERKQRREERVPRKDGTPGVDPDIAGIVPGPQPIAE
ncbi:MAG: hypothetical protein ACHREM_14400 [Polyangiales bacterium]